MSALISSSAYAQSSFHPEKLAPSKTEKKNGRSLSDDIDMNQIKEVNLLVRDCTCLRDVGEGVSSTDQANSRHISIPCRDTRWSKSLPELTPWSDLDAIGTASSIRRLVRDHGYGSP